MLHRFGSHGRRGAAAVSYALLVALVALAILAAVAATGGGLSRLMGTTANRIGAPDAGDSAAAPSSPPSAPPGTAVLSVQAPGADAMDIAATAVPASSAPLTVTVLNSGSAAAAALQPVLAGAGFSITSDSCTGTALAAGATCTLQVVASASADGSLDGTLTLAGTQLALHGTASGFAPELVLPGDDPLAIAAIAGGVSPGACTDIALSNGGLLEATGLAASLGGSDAAHFAPCTAGATPACTGTLAAGATCHLGYRTLASASGSFAATLTVTAGNAAAVTRGLASSAAGFAAKLDIGSGEWDLAPLTGGNSPGPCTPLTVTNTGNAAGLGGAAISIWPGAYMARCTPSAGTACSAAVLAPGASCVLGLQVVGSSNFSIGADITVAAEGQTATRRAEGEASGFDPVLSVAAGTVAVADVPAGNSPGACTAVAITNTGKGAGLYPTAIQLSGSGSGAFASCAAASNPCTGQLAVNASCNLGLRLVATANGSYSATATFIYAGQSQSRSVTGSVAGYNALQVSTATYGANCGCAAGNLTASLAPLCNGQGSCSFDPLARIGDCAVGCVKNVSVGYSCNGSARSYLYNTNEAGNRTHTLTCP